MFTVLKHKLMLGVLAVVLVLSLVVPGCAEREEKHAIFTFSVWSGDWLTIYVPKILLEEELNYTTEIVDLSVAAAWTAIARGEADLWTDSWQPNQKKLKEKYAETTESLGMVYGDCFEGWMVPKWVSEQYGITSVTDLDGPEMAKLFDVDGDGIGDLLGCDAAWVCAKVNDEKIAGYGLDALYQQRYGMEAMMVAAIEGRMKKEEAVLFYLYTPHPFFVRYPIGESVVWLEDPKGFQERVVNVYKFGNVDWIEENPEAAELLRQVEMTPEDISWMMAQIEEKGDKAAVLEALAREWMAEHQAEIDSWLEAIK